MKTQLSLLGIGIFLLQGCALRIDTLQPTPSLHLTKSNATMALSIAGAVKDSFFIPPYSGVKKSKVVHWHASLTNGFTNGFRNHFTIVPAEDAPQYTLRIEKAMLYLRPSAVGGYFPTTVLNVELHFQAALVGPKGHTLQSIEGVVTSNKPIGMKGQEKAACESAVENMYALMADQLF